MSISRCARYAVLALAMLAVGAAAAEESANIRLELHWDRETGTSKAVVKAGLEDVLAEVAWDGALPRTYASGSEETEVPTFIVGALRDQLADSSHLHADQAWAFVRGLMGSHADTPLSQLSNSSQTWVSYTDVRVDETCGTVVDVNSECTEPSTSQLATTFCTESACKVTKIRPLEGDD